MVVFLALLAALISGAADYTGGRASKQHPALIVTFYSHCVGALLLPLCALAIGWERLHGGDVVLGLVGGVSVGVAYLIFFRALAAGRMSVIAPLAALTTALVPLVVDIIDGVSLPGGRWAGVGVALLAIPALSYRSDNGQSTFSLRREIVYSVAAGIAFAGFFVSIGHTSSDSGQWPVAFAAMGATTAMAVVSVAQNVQLGRPPRVALFTGLLMVGSGLAINRALQIGPLGVVTVLGSMYPLATTALANRFDREPISAINLTGIIAAVGGAALIAVYR